MEIIFNTGLVLLPVLYTVLVMAYAKIFARQASGLALFVRPLLGGTLVVHMATLLTHGVHVGACPLGRTAEFLALVSCLVGVIYLLLEVRVRERATGVFVLILAFAVQVIATVSILVSDSAVDYPVGAIPSLYLFTAVIGYSAVVVSSIYGMLYLFLYRAIKTGRFGLFYRKMPPLEILSRLNYQSAWIGFTAVTVTALLVVYQWQAVEALPASVPAVAFTSVLWVLFGGCLLAKRFWSLGGKRLAYTTLLGLVCILGVLVSGIFSSPGAG